MSRPGGSEGPQQVPGWVMSANELIERLFLLLRINAVWWILTLLGAVVLGLAPATAAAVDALLASREQARVRVLPLMWRRFRAGLVRANLQMLPLFAVQAGALAMLVIAFSGAVTSAALMVALVAVAAISLPWATTTVAAILASPRLRRQELTVTWRIALLVPGALPMRAVALIGGLTLWILLCGLIPPVALLVGAAGALDLAIGLLGRSIAALLEKIDQAPSP
ncbi:DUF624 domain-containing protein [uncultured Brachybacterium sp.]|uniref:DUF624 domain-containing protein n=1 Tax=uncultured Brachybacterium sp. TaxID=189680 RepID=UPI002607A055|nr:DUF624 domain-containing protein [uncultured Brachybacterium sp.]